MAPTKQAPTRQAITLKGSTNLVTEFFKYAANTYVHREARCTPKLSGSLSESCSREVSILRMTFTW